MYTNNIFEACTTTVAYIYISKPEGEQGVQTPPPLKNHKNVGFLSNTGRDPQKNHKVTKPPFNIGPSSARQRNSM